MAGTGAAGCGDGGEEESLPAASQLDSGPPNRAIAGGKAAHDGSGIEAPASYYVTGKVWAGYSDEEKADAAAEYIASDAGCSASDPEGLADQVDAAYASGAPLPALASDVMSDVCVSGG